MADNNPVRKDVRWFNWGVLGVFVLFFMIAWGAVQGIHQHIDGGQWPLPWNKLKPQQYSIAWTHYWLSEWFLIIFTSYIVSLLTLFIGNTIDWKNEASESDKNKASKTSGSDGAVDNCDWIDDIEKIIGRNVLVRKLLGWVPGGIRDLRRVSPTYDLAIFTLGIGVLISAAVLFVSEACSLTELDVHAASWSDVLKADPGAFTPDSIVRAIALALAGGRIGPDFIWGYLGALFVLFVLTLGLCALAGVIVVRAANNLCVYWGKKERDDASTKSILWEHISRHLDGAIIDAKALLDIQKACMETLRKK